MWVVCTSAQVGSASRILDISISCAVQQHTTGSRLLTKVLKGKLELWIVCRSLCCCTNTRSISARCVGVQSTVLLFSFALPMNLYLPSMWKSPLQSKVFLLLELCFCSLSARSSGKESSQQRWKTWGIEFFLRGTLSARALVQASLSLKLFSVFSCKNLHKFSRRHPFSKSIS